MRPGSTLPTTPGDLEEGLNGRLVELELCQSMPAFAATASRCWLSHSSMAGMLRGLVVSAAERQIHAAAWSKMLPGPGALHDHATGSCP